MYISLNPPCSSGTSGPNGYREVLNSEETSQFSQTLEIDIFCYRAAGGGGVKGMVKGMKYAFKTKKGMDGLEFLSIHYAKSRGGRIHLRSDHWLVEKVSKNNDFPCTLQRDNTENSKQIFPEKELHGLSPNSTFMCL
jgi:hypothetical protein